MNKKRVFAYGILLIVVIVFAFIGGIVYSQNTDVVLPDIPGLFMGKSFSGMIVSVKETPAEEGEKEAKKELEIKTVDGNLESFVINSATRIALPDKKLEMGKFVKVIYKDTKTVKIAKIVKSVKNPPKMGETPEDVKESPEMTPGGETPAPEVTDKPEGDKTGEPKVEGDKKEEPKVEGEKKEEPKAEGDKKEEPKVEGEKKEEPAGETK